MLDGEKVFIKAAVHTLSGYSAHADQKDLIRIASRMRHPPQDIRLVHGDGDAKEELRKQLQRALPAAKVMIAG